jgi:hypothetical protein
MANYGRLRLAVESHSAESVSQDPRAIDFEGIDDNFGKDLLRCVQFLAEEISQEP